MSSKKVKQFLSLIVSLALVSSLSFTPVYAGELLDGVTIDIAVTEDSVTTADDTTDNSGESTDTAADGTDTTDSAASSDAETAEQADTTEQTETVEQADAAEQETDAPAEEETESPAETTKAPAVNAASAAAASTEAVTELQAAIDALPSVDELADMDSDELYKVYTTASELWDVYYDDLTEDEQTDVDVTKLEELSDYFNGAVALAETETATLEGISGSTVTDYVNHAYAYTWDFSGVSASTEAGTYDVGNGLTVTLNSNSSINSSYNGIYGKDWIYDYSENTNDGIAKQYVTFTPTESGTLYFDAYYEAYNNNNRGVTGRIYYTTDGSLPHKGSSSDSDDVSYILDDSNVSQTTDASSLTGLSLSVESGTTYILAIYRGSQAANSALYNFKFIVSDDYNETITPISGSFDSTTGDYGTYTWDFESTGTGASTYTYSDYYADITIGVGSGDSLIANDGTATSYGIHYSASSVKETSTDGQASVGDTGRYIMVTPSVAGTINFGIQFTGVANSNSPNNRIYYVSYANSSSITLSDIKKPDTATTSNQVGNNMGTSLTTCSLTLEANTTYVFYTYQYGSYISSLTFTPSDDLGIVTGKNIDLEKGNITMNVYVAESALDTSKDVTTTIGGNDPYHSVETSTGTSTVDGNTVYTISQNILAYQMADDIVFTIPLTGGGTYTYTTSVKDYAKAAITELESDSTDTTASKKIAVLNAMLDYGSAIQQCIDTSIEDSSETLANGGSWQDGVSEFVSSSSTDKISRTSSTSGSWSDNAKLQSMNMNFNYNFNIGLTYGESIEDCTATVKIGTADYDSSKVKISGSSVIIEGLTAADLSKALEVTVTSGSNSYTTTTTPLYYARLLVAKGDTAQQKLGKTLYLYSQAVDSLAS